MAPGALQQAQAADTAAHNAWNNLPFAVTGNNSISGSTAGGGSTTEGTAAIVMCEAVNSPAVLVNQGIDAVFKSLNLGNYTNSNLPQFLSQISQMATQIGSSLVLGGITGNPPTINENLAIGQGVTPTQAATIQTLNNNAISNMQQGIDLEIYPTSGGYSITWTVNTQQVGTASYVTISGPGIANPAARLALTNSGNPLNVVSAVAGNYILNVYDASNKLLISVSQQGTPTTSSGNSLNSLNPISFSASSGITGTSATLNWQVSPSQLPSASYVIISNSNNFFGPFPQQPLTGSMTVTPATTAITYTLTVYDANGNVVGTATQQVAAASQQSYNYNSNGPEVAGAFTSQPAILPRGPASVIYPRGE